MQRLEEIISNPKAIVIQSRRKDQAIVTATRVPLGDIRLIMTKMAWRNYLIVMVDNVIRDYTL